MPTGRGCSVLEAELPSDEEVREEPARALFDGTVNGTVAQIETSFGERAVHVWPVAHDRRDVESFPEKQPPADLGAKGHGLVALSRVAEADVVPMHFDIGEDVELVEKDDAESTTGRVRHEGLGARVLLRRRERTRDAVNVEPVAVRVRGDKPLVANIDGGIEPAEDQRLQQAVVERELGPYRLMGLKLEDVRELVRGASSRPRSPSV